jgi:purine-cytosine permease-like protein
MLGPLVFELSLKDAALCAVFGAMIGSLGPAYTCTWGLRSGNRTMVSRVCSLSLHAIPKLTPICRS